MDKQKKKLADKDLIRAKIKAHIAEKYKMTIAEFFKSGHCDKIHLTKKDKENLEQYLQLGNPTFSLPVINKLYTGLGLGKILREKEVKVKYFM